MAIEILEVLPKNIRELIEKDIPLNQLQEIRLKVNKPLFIYSNNKEKNMNINHLLKQ